MCNTIRWITSEILDENFLRDVISIEGCASLTNFILHLKRNGCTDYDYEKLQKIVNECEECSNQFK